MKRLRALLVIGAVAALSVAPLHADTGIPMLVVVWPGAWLVLLPVIVIEAVAARKTLGLTTRRALAVSAKANVVSAAVGIPLTWILLALIEIGFALACDQLPFRDVPEWLNLVLGFTVGAAWPSGDYMGSWGLPLTAAVLCLPFFVSSVYVESWVMKRVLPEAGSQAVRTWSVRANLWSYSLIVGVLLVTALWFAALDRGATPNPRVNAPVGPVTPLACASVAPVRPARYAARYAH